MDTGHTWYEYRDVWATHPWVLALAVVAVLVVIAAAIATFTGGALALLFIPGLAGLYGHHLLVKRIADE
jgi:Mn2+/Fe2+ NRAMP family transporter